MSDIHQRKVRWLQDQGMKTIGIVLAHPSAADKGIAIVAGAAVRWLSRSEMWDLMHPPESTPPAQPAGDAAVAQQDQRDSDTPASV